MGKWVFLFFYFVFYSGAANCQVKNDTLRLFYEINEIESEANNNRMDSLFEALHGKFIKIKIIGYADFLHTSKYNYVLSQKRADAVKNYIEKKARPSQINSISAKGMGERHSKDNSSSLGEPFQRRVDVIIEPVVIVESYDDTGVKGNNNGKNGKLKKIEDLEKGESLAIEGLNFEPGRHVLVKGSMPVLEQLLKTLQENPALKIEIQGHICCVTDNTDGMDVDTHERKLSFNRAQAVYNYLVKKGIDPERLTYKGYARTKPKIFPEKTEADEQANRRVEIMILEK